MGLWTYASRNSEAFFDPDLLVRTFGNIPEDLLERLLGTRTSTVKPLAEGYAAWFCTTLRAMLPDLSVDTWLAVSRWVDDGTPFPGEAFRQWVRDFYQGNKLVRGEIELRNRRVELSEIECSLLNIAGAKDIICPPSQAETTMHLVASRDKERLVFDAGHVGLMASPEARGIFWPKMERWLEPRSR